MLTYTSNNCMNFYTFLFILTQGLLKNHPKHASILRLSGEGNWLHQFRAVTLIRISPLPYILFNYAVVATNVNYSPYLLGTLVGMVPEVLIALYRLNPPLFHACIYVNGISQFLALNFYPFCQFHLQAFNLNNLVLDFAKYVLNKFKHESEIDKMSKDRGLN